VLTVQGSGFQGSGFRVQGSGFRVQGLGSKAFADQILAPGFEFDFQDFGFKVEGFGFGSRVQSLAFGVEGLGVFGCNLVEYVVAEHVVLYPEAVVLHRE